MKRNILFLIILFAFACNAQIALEVNNDGDYRSKSSEGWSLTGFKASDEALPYIKSFPKAINNPNDSIFIKQSRDFKKMENLFSVLVVNKKRGILYDFDDNIVLFFEKETKEEEKSFLLVFALISTFFMVLSNILVKKRFISFFISILFIIISFIFAVLAISFSPFVVAKHLIIITSVFAFLSAPGALASVAAYDNFKTYKIFVSIYYIFMIMYFICMFLGV